MINLFFNAIDAMPKGGNIFVEAALQAVEAISPSCRLAYVMTVRVLMKQI